MSMQEPQNSAVQGQLAAGEWVKVAAVHEVPGPGPHPLFADTHATAAGDAAVLVALHEIGLIVETGARASCVQVDLLDAQGVRQVLQLAFTALVADGALDGVVMRTSFISSSRMASSLGWWW